MTIAREITREVTIAHTAGEFERWVANAEPGAVCEYHRGVTCLVEGERNSKSDKKKGLLAVKVWKKVPTAAMAWDLGPATLAVPTSERAYRSPKIQHGLGVVELVQRRNGENDYSYLAIKRRGRAA